MVNYTCHTCLKEFKKKSHYIVHTEKKKNPCQPIIPKNSNLFQSIPNYSKNTIFSEKNEENTNLDIDIDIKDNNISCEYCNKNFSTKFNLNKHIKNSCKEKKILDKKYDEKEKENMLLKKEIEELKKLFYEFSKSKGRKSMRQNIKNSNNTNTTNIQTQNNTNNTQNNNINIILPHGKELENIGLGEVLDHMLTYNFREMIPNLVKHIYLNADKPENLNFIVNDLARNKCKYYNGEKWVTGKTNEKILCMFENTNSLFVDPFNEPQAKKTVEFIRKNKKYAEKYPTILKCKNYAKGLFNEWDKESMDLRQKILDELKIIFYNHKDEILEIEC